MSHNHDHDHGGVFYSHAPAGKMKLAFFLTLIILAVETVGGVISNSLALFSDAGHVLTDLFALGLSWYAMNQTNKPADEKMTYGYQRSGILAALANGVTLIIILVVILWEAYTRFLNPQPVHPTWMFIGAGTGLVINLFLGFGMMGHEDNLNVRSVVLHVLGDAAASAGVIVGGIIIIFTGLDWIDSILSVMIAALIGLSAWRVMKQTVVILMEGTPKGMDLQKVINEIKGVQGIHDVHDVHVWSITDGKNALSCHVVLDGSLSIRESQNILRDVEHRMIHMNIGHVTVQTEDKEHPHEDSELCATVEAVHHHH